MELIDRQAAIDAIWLHTTILESYDYEEIIKKVYKMAHRHIVDVIKQLPPAEPERDIPIKPKETTDRTWGIQSRQAVCSKCDYYLSNFVFLGDGKGKRVTYCEHCGQAIDWEGWDVDE